MATSVLSSIFNLLDSKNISDIASRLGEPEHAVSQGLETATASLMNSLAGRAGDPTAMSQIFRLISQAPPDVSVSNLAGAVSGAGGASSATTSLLDLGKKFLWEAFGGEESSILESIGKSAGLGIMSISSIMGLAAPLLMSALGRMVRTEKMNPAQLGSWLQKERSSVQSLLPARLRQDYARMTPYQAKLDESPSPLSITAVREPHRGAPSWLLWIIAAIIVFGLLTWLFNRAHLRRISQNAAEQVRIGANDLGGFVSRTLPNRVDLHIPLRGMEMRLLDYVQDPSKNPDQVTWFDFDRLLFDTDSPRLRPESQEQLQNIAAILKAYPNVHVKVGGYTDNTGDAQHNLKLSQDRADGVVAQLVAFGIAPDRLQAQGYGDQYPVADNATEAGRAKNRRISMRVTAK